MSACHAFASSTLVIQNHLLGDFPAKLQPSSFLCPFPCPSQYEATALLLRERSAVTAFLPLCYTKEVIC